MQLKLEQFKIDQDILKNDPSKDYIKEMAEKAAKNIDDAIRNYMKKHHLAKEDLKNFQIISAYPWPYINQEFYDKDGITGYKQEFSIAPC